MFFFEVLKSNWKFSCVFQKLSNYVFKFLNFIFKICLKNSFIIFKNSLLIRFIFWIYFSSLPIFISAVCECSGLESLTNSVPSTTLVTARARQPNCLYFVHFQLIKFSLSLRLTVKEYPSMRSFRPPRLVCTKFARSKFVSRSMTKSSVNEK